MNRPNAMSDHQALQARLMQQAIQQQQLQQLQFERERILNQMKRKQKKEEQASAARILQQRGIGGPAAPAQHGGANRGVPPKATTAAAAAAGTSGAGANPASGGADDEDVDGFGDGLEEESYSVVSTADLEALGLRKHPDAIAECVSLSSVLAPKASYKSRLPAHVLLGETSTGFWKHSSSTCAFEVPICRL